MGNVVDTTKPVSQTRQMSGRRVIKSSVKKITEQNVVDVLQAAMADHNLNRSEIEYLWNYRFLLHQSKSRKPHKAHEAI